MKGFWKALTDNVVGLIGVTDQKTSVSFQRAMRQRILWFGGRVAGKQVAKGVATGKITNVFIFKQEFIGNVVIILRNTNTDKTTGIPIKMP